MFTSMYGARAQTCRQIFRSCRSNSQERRVVGVESQRRIYSVNDCLGVLFSTLSLE